MFLQLAIPYNGYFSNALIYKNKCLPRISKNIYENGKARVFFKSWVHETAMLLSLLLSLYLLLRVFQFRLHFPSFSHVQPC